MSLALSDLFRHQQLLLWPQYYHSQQTRWPSVYNKAQNTINLGFYKRTTVTLSYFTLSPYQFPCQLNYTSVLIFCGGGAVVQCCGRWMDRGQRGRAVKDKATTEKTGNSMSSGLRADGREAGGRGRGMGPYLPWSLNLEPEPPWSWSVVVVGGFKGTHRTCWKLCTFQCAFREGPTHPRNQ